MGTFLGTLQLMAPGDGQHYKFDRSFWRWISQLHQKVEWMREKKKAKPSQSEMIEAFTCSNIG